MEIRDYGDEVIGWREAHDTLNAMWQESTPLEVWVKSYGAPKETLPQDSAELIGTSESSNLWERHIS